jgi:CelD/BcsL family acetyltransferase involved in cellulose biosynthesis
MEVLTEPATNWPSIASRWQQLAESCAGSIFLSPLWIETWLETFGDVVQASLVTFRAAGQDVGVCMVVQTPASLARPLRRLSLNASGEPAEDTLYVELNDVLCRPGWQTETARALGAYVIGQSWDECKLDGFCPGPVYDELKREFAGLEIEENWQASYYVNIAALRTAGISYAQALGPGREKYLQRKLRYHAQLGELRVEAAATSEQAGLMLDELAVLNLRRFRKLGRSSIWNSKRFWAFHRSFIRRGFAAGNVQLLRVTAGQELVGLLFNLVHNNKVYFYQCGYNYTADRRLSPGVVTLALAVEYSREAGFDEFDFLAGDSAYKEWMSTGCRRLTWTSFRRASARVWIYNRLRALKHKVRR